MKKISVPHYLEHALYYEPFVALVDAQIGVLDQLKQQSVQVSEILRSNTPAGLRTPYAPGKWCILDIIQHLCDVERIFVARALRFSRGDTSPQAFFDENQFALQALASKKSVSKLLKEYKTNRQASICFFANQSAAELKRTGIAGNYTMSVRACAYIICGHEKHHLQIIQERYV